jgi:taurine--2-oxoglutarate transaminase
MLDAATVERETREYVLVPWSTQSQVRHIPVTHAQGCWFYDANGKAYLDFSAQLINVNIGYQHPKVVAAIKEQAERLCYIGPTFDHESRSTLARMIAEVAPPGLKKTMFTTGGTEANENAIKIARMYTGRQKVISRYRSYHGGTYGSMSVGGDSRRWPWEPGIPGVVRVFDPYRYRCPFCSRAAECTLQCVAHIEEVIWYEGPDQIAAIMLEGVTGSNGVIVPPPRYWPEVRRLCDKYGILLISDEVMSGFGRTGKWFAVQHWDVAPDIMTFAKGVTSGYVPLGGVIISEKIARFLDDRPFPSGLTYAGHPLACAAGMANMQVYKEENLIERAATLGQTLGTLLQGLYQRHLSVGEVRGLGLFWAVELVKDRESREPLVPWNAPTQGVLNDIRNAALDRGLYVYGRWNILIIAPPLTVTEEELRLGVSILDEVLEIADRAAKS